MTHNGVYRWVRLPMGLTGAGSHFQNCLAVEVLKDLLYKVIELYLDDGIVPAEDDDQFIENLRLVFQRFLEHNITLFPSKCVLGLSQIENVSCTTNSDWLHSMLQNRQCILFAKLTANRQVKSIMDLVKILTNVSGIIPHAWYRCINLSMTKQSSKYTKRWSEMTNAKMHLRIIRRQ